VLIDQIVQAVGLFAVTSIDNIVILALFFSRTADRPDGAVPSPQASTSGSRPSSPSPLRPRWASGCCPKP
jgi:hypothetical protein